MSASRPPETTAMIVVMLVLALLGLAAPATAQNGFSFSDAARAASGYSRAAVRPQMACRDLLGMTEPDVSIVSAEVVAPAEGVPEHCRVNGVPAPEIRFQVNLPAAWNRRFYMNGNGGFAGESSEAGARPALRATALRHGFRDRDDQHRARRHPGTAGDVRRAQLPEAGRLRVPGRAPHRGDGQGHRDALHDRTIAFAYWDGCSTGGRQALMEAQRFPADFDGIVAGAVYARCDGVDGLVDGIVDDPRRCDFDPARDLPVCAAGFDGAGCITAAQAAALRKMYGGVVSNGTPYFPGQPIGAEKVGIPPFGPPQPASGWDRWLVAPAGTKPLQLAFPESFMKYAAFGKADPAYDWKTFDFDKDPARLVAIRRLLAANGPETTDFFRLFMVPGMFHCRGGVGPDRFDAMSAVIDWVERGIAPRTLTATRVEDGAVVRTRPLCPYPQVARYGGSGSADAAASFACTEPR
jgi:tannase/feruloyl esterase